MSLTNFIEKSGDLLEADEAVIVQQLNCLCVKPHGLSAAITKKFPYADVYGGRKAQGFRNLAITKDQGIPGEIVLSFPWLTLEDDDKTKKPPIVVGLYGQYDYGKPGYSARRSTMEQDNYVLRELWFNKALKELREWLIANGVKSVAFPYGIGCGLAGGNWTRYVQLLKQFAEGAPYKVVIYRMS